MVIIGVCGSIGAGKTTFVEYLVSKGFKHFNLSDEIRKKSKVKSPIRAYLQNFGNNLRKTHGTDYLAKEVWNKINKLKSSKFVIDGVRNVGEVEFLKRQGNFCLVAVISSPKNRFKRLIDRGSSKDPSNWLEFQTMNSRDLSESKYYGQQSKLVISLAGIKIANNGSLLQFQQKIDFLLEKIST